MKTVQDLIGDDYKSWDGTKPIVICAPTGSGKTHFILNTFLPYVAKIGRSICYLSNRIILKKQVQFKIPEEFSDSIIIRNYQQGNPDPNAYYWGFDEAHFFHSDSPFNVDIANLADHLKDRNNLNMRQHVCIFMTATPEYLFLFLAEILNGVSSAIIPVPYYISDGIETADVMETKWQISSANNLLKYKEISCYKYEQLCRATRDATLVTNYIKENYAHQFNNVMHVYSKLFDYVKQKLYLYDLEKDYSYIRPCYYWDDSELVELVKATPCDEKWLIFVSNREDGRKLQLDLIKSGIDNVAYLDARHGDSNGKIARRSIIDNESFPQRVLICTKVLDNGSNINDPAVKHIVLPPVDKTTFLQMLGRKRVDRSHGEVIMVYFRYLSVGTMKKYFDRHYLDIMNCLFMFLHYKSEHWENIDSDYKKRRSGMTYTDTSGITYIYPSENEYEVPHQRDILATNKKHIHILYSNVNRFLKQFAKEGNISDKYSSYFVLESNYLFLPTIQSLLEKNQHRNHIIERSVLDSHTINLYSRNHLVYEYYKMLAMFESYDNQKESSAVQGSNQEIPDTMWLEEQLGWLGLTYDPQRWNTVLSGEQAYTRRQVEEFLEEHQGVLTREYENILKDLVLKYLRTIRPKVKEAKSKASFQTVSNVFGQYGFPYLLEKERRTINGTDRYWWSIEKIE